MGVTYVRTHPVILTRRQNSMLLQELSSYSGCWCSCTLTVPAEEVNTTRLTVPASLQALMMLKTPLTVGLMISFYKQLGLEHIHREREREREREAACCKEKRINGATSGSLDSKSMGVATWNTPSHPLITSAKLPSSSKSALQIESRSADPGRSSRGLTFF